MGRRFVRPITHPYNGCVIGERALVAVLALAGLACGSSGNNPAVGGGTMTACGDNLLAGDEACDDGNGDPGDGCSPACAIEDGWICAALDDGSNRCFQSWRLDLLSWIEGTVAALPGKHSGGLVVPSVEQVSAFKGIAAQVVTDDWSSASQLAEPLGYRVIQIVDLGHGDEILMALVPAAWSAAAPTGGDGRGLFVWRSASQSTRALVLAAPHPRFDLHTAVIAADVFRQLGARAFFMAGTHRCANAVASGCSGTTAACSDAAEPFRESDAPHATQSFVQAFHEALDGADGGHLTHLQIHGMGSTTLAFSTSDGTTTDTADAHHPSNRLAEQLEVLMAGSSSLPGNSCNRIGDADELCATTNTQGRYSNGVDAQLVCTQSSGGQATGRFVHAELGPDLRDPDGPLGPQLLIAAVEQAFP
jgi:cysteine-rich repeat protein